MTSNLLEGAGMNDDAKQRLLRLNVGEVSIVDLPANERPFLVIKNKQGTGATKTPNEKPVEKAAPCGTGGGGMPDEMKKAVEQLGSIAESMKALFGEKKPGDGGYPYPAPMKKGLAFDPSSGDLFIDGEKVEKAKGFTGARVGVLKDALANLSKLMGEVDAPALKELVEKLKAELPALSASPGQSVVPTGTASTPVPPLVDMEKVSKAIGDLAEVTKRLDAIEKARNPATSANSTDAPGEKPVVKSLWNGVL